MHRDDNYMNMKILKLETETIKRWPDRPTTTWIGIVIRHIKTMGVDPELRSKSLRTRREMAHKD